MNDEEKAAEEHQRNNVGSLEVPTSGEEVEQYWGGIKGQVAVGGEMKVNGSNVIRGEVRVTKISLVGEEGERLGSDEAVEDARGIIGCIEQEEEEIEEFEVNQLVEEDENEGWETGVGEGECRGGMGQVQIENDKRLLFLVEEESGKTEAKDFFHVEDNVTMEETHNVMVEERGRTEGREIKRCRREGHESVEEEIRRAKFNCLMKEEKERMVTSVMREKRGSMVSTEIVLEGRGRTETDVGEDEGETEAKVVSRGEEEEYSVPRFVLTSDLQLMLPPTKRPISPIVVAVEVEEHGAVEKVKDAGEEMGMDGSMLKKNQIELKVEQQKEESLPPGFFTVPLHHADGQKHSPIKVGIEEEIMLGVYEKMKEKAEDEGLPPGYKFFPPQASVPSVVQKSSHTRHAPISDQLQPSMPQGSQPNTLTLPPPPTPAYEMAQMVCGSCRRLLSYIRGARYVQCSCCQTVNFVLEEHQVGQVKCSSCTILLLYPYGAPSVKCSSCHFVTEIGDHNKRPRWSVQQRRTSSPSNALV
ncbi:hypothetical protein SAY87_020190 [Trapa incisa]|uniref:Zinc finger LSD1-type domain-containing protein n=1 Tax=Trapa incisa TaxID=236973 RepID=A0AAN7K3H2_9MYRT|nr:hypothetical protein SAY87_020190 [Trapa incisa]